MEKTIYKNDFIKITEDEDSFVIYDSINKFLTRIYKEDFDDTELAEMIEDFKKLVLIKDEEKLIKELQRFDISITDCYYDSAIEMFKQSFKYEIEISTIAQDMADMLDEEKVNRYLMAADCVNKIGRLYVYYEC